MSEWEEWEGIDFSRFIYECQKTARAPLEIRRQLEDNGVTLVPVDQYSPVPLLRDLDDTFEGAGASQQPIYDRVFDQELIREYINGMIEFAPEFDPPRKGDLEKKVQFFWDNPLFSFCDAMAYYCLIRMRKPQRIVEIGAGYATLVASAGITKNGFGEIVCIDAAPEPFVTSIPHIRAIVKRRIQDVSPEEFNSIIGPASILFTDTTHTVKLGSDALYIYLALLPQISKHLLVHSHDIYLPFGMPTEFSRDFQIHWNEQYLVYALLLGNPAARVLYGSNYAHKYLAPELARLMTDKYPIGGASLWYELNRPMEYEF